ncbi:uncharacterized protein At1g65710-like [Quercus lobata]|uniref:Uncharacterized protein n=1 Tax=Quercus lobata TaxID=97700 RepID=A0A7N2QZA8_QUELO|nr:uncharacterized protein At1g65710-like [Quercus lobata]
MGTCFSKKKESSSSSSSSCPSAVVGVASTPKTDPDVTHLSNDTRCNNDNTHKAKVENSELKMKLKKEKKIVQEDQQVEEDESGVVKREIFVIKHRKSHDDRDRNTRSPPPPQQDCVASTTTSNEVVPESMANKVATRAAASIGVGVRTSSCTKEEVDAILIQCGRLSRSSSGKAASSSASASADRGRKYSGSKRSYDFDRCENEVVAAVDDVQKKANVIDDLCLEDERRNHHRQRHRQSSRPSSSSQGRRRTPSREREKDQQQRSSSRERRVSRSPGRRSSETSTPASTTTVGATHTYGNGTNRPGKMVSVPATVSSLVMDKSNNAAPAGESATGTSVKRISVRRNAGSDAAMAASRGAASPRSQSPARANGKISNDNQQPSLSRSSSRKAEHSPYRRNPLSEIDTNSLAYPQPPNNNSKVQNRNKRETEEGIVLNQKPNAEIINSSNNRAVHGTNNKTSNRGALDNQVVTVNCIQKEQLVEEARDQQPSATGHVTIKTVVASGAENLKPQAITRSRSGRRSRDLDLNSETLLNPTSSYAALLLEDIQNFHQKSNTPSVSLPACVTKACSILEAVADLNSTTSSNLSCAFSEDRKSPTYQSNREAYNFALGATLVGKRVEGTKDPFVVESEVAVTDDVTEPSFHKYVTVRRGGALVGAADMEDQESSGSNSFVAGGQQQHWGLSSSSWEPNSADSTDCWTSGLNTREEDQKSPLGFEGSGLSEPGRNMNETRKRLSGKKSDCDQQRSGGIGRGRLGTSRGLHSTPVVAAAAST